MGQTEERMAIVEDINSKVESSSKMRERERLEKEHSQVWSTAELTKEFTVEAFLAPYVICINKKTGKRGTMQFQHMPRFYFAWKEE